MKIISLKRNAGDSTDVKETPSYEIVYKKDTVDSRPATVSIKADTEYGKKLDEANKARQSKLVLTDEDNKAYLDLIVEAVEENTSVVVERVLDEIAEESEAISSRIKLVNGAVLKIGEHTITGPLSDQIMAMVKARRQDKSLVSTDDWRSLINFAELLYDNVDSHIRNQLYAWLMYQIKNGRLTLTPEGKFLGYKGCQKNGETIESIHSGPGIVNGEVMNGHLPNNPGDIVEMSREAVDNDPNSHCSTGLHVGSYNYANSFSRGVVVLVEVDPRDVVSVPYDYNGQKLRACKYRVVKEVEDELSEFSIDFESTAKSPAELVELMNEDTEAPSSEKPVYTGEREDIDSIKSKLDSALDTDDLLSIVYSKDGVSVKEYAEVEVESIHYPLVTVITEDGYRSFNVDQIVRVITEDEPEVEVDPAILARETEATIKSKISAAHSSEETISLVYSKDGVETSEYTDVDVKLIHFPLVTVDTPKGPRSFLVDKIVSVDNATMSAQYTVGDVIGDVIYITEDGDRRDYGQELFEVVKFDNRTVLVTDTDGNYKNFTIANIIQQTL